jgi:hypothetical protein
MGPIGIRKFEAAALAKFGKNKRRVYGARWFGSLR